MKKYIHYGCTKFIREYFNPIRNANFIKPNGGFWASPVDAGLSWKDWCDNTENRSWLNGGSFTFTLTEDAKVYHLYSVHDLLKLPENRNGFLSKLSDSNYFIDFEACYRSGIDAIELHLSDEKDKPEGFINGLYWKLYGWDVDSILILNPDIIVMKGDKNE